MFTGKHFYIFHLCIFKEQLISFAIDFQIVKFNDEACCTPCRSLLKKLLPTGFLPPPYPLQHTLKKQDPHSQSVSLDNFIPDNSVEGFKLHYASLILKKGFDSKPEEKELGFIQWIIIAQQ